jgi:glycosyltransferase involved in cell wall biosynthesis
MKILVWQWGRFGAGPRTAVDFAAGFADVRGVDVLLSLSRTAEIMLAPQAPPCALPITTYRGAASYLARLATAPVLTLRLARALKDLAPDVALCAMPGPLDLAMQAALMHAGIPSAVVVHDADAHPGDGYPMQMTLQRMLVRRADALVVLSEHVAGRLDRQGLLRGKTLIRTTLPHPEVRGLAPVRAHGGPFRLLSFGRLLAYKGLDLLAEALRLTLPETGMVVRVIGQGPDSAALDALRRMDKVTVENRWVPEAEIADLLAWADGVVLPYKEASQSGVAAAALAARRLVLATRVGGLAEQVEGKPGCIVCAVNAASLAEGLRALPMLAAPELVPHSDAAALVSALRQLRRQGALPPRFQAAEKVLTTLH